MMHVVGVYSVFSVMSRAKGVLLASVGATYMYMYM